MIIFKSLLTTFETNVILEENGSAVQISISLKSYLISKFTNLSLSKSMKRSVVQINFLALSFIV